VFLGLLDLVVWLFLLFILRDRGGKRLNNTYSVELLSSGGIIMYQESLLNLISINNDVLWGVILVMGHLVSTTLALAIFSSILLQNKKNGLLFLILLIVMGVLTLYRVMTYSITLGLIIGFMYIILCFVTFFSLKKKMTRENQL
jgi:hypothetical protein